MRTRWSLAAAATGALLALAAATAFALPGGTREPGRPVAVGATAGTTAGPTSSAATTTAPPTSSSAAPPASAAAPVPSASSAAPPAPAAAGRITPGVTHSGAGTWYAADGGGACLFDPGPDPLTAAMNWADFDNASACGAYVLVRAANGASVTVRITNLCPAPCRVGQVDLSKEAFARLANPQQGEIPITWTLVSPAVQGTISVRYKTGSSQWWCGIQVINHRNPVARLEVRTGAGWKSLSRTDYNYFLSPDGSGCGGAIAVTDLYGQRLVIDPLPVQPNVTQPTPVQFDQH